MRRIHAGYDHEGIGTVINDNKITVCPKEHVANIVNQEDLTIFAFPF